MPVPTRDSDSTMNTLEEVLEKAFSFLRRDWVRQFLLESTAAQDLGLLTAQDKLEHALSGTIRMRGEGARFAISNVFSGGELDEQIIKDVNSDWVVVPALGVEDISARLMVMHIQGAKMRLVHQVSNDDTGDVLAIAMDRSSDMCEVMLITQSLATGSRRRNFFRIPVRALRSYDAAAAARVVQFRASADETRSCTRCITRCTCAQLVRSRVRHPLDFATASRNMLTHIGKFAGTLTNTIFVAGEPYSSPPHPIFGGLESGCNANLMASFLGWAVQHTLTDGLLQSTPTAYPSIMPAPGAPVGNPFDPLGSESLFLDGAEHFFDATIDENARNSNMMHASEAHANTPLPDGTSILSSSSNASSVPITACPIASTTPVRVAPHAPQITSLQALVPAAPVAFIFGAAPSNRPDATAQTGTPSTNESDKDLKAFQRKLRNRESAARCNKRNQQLRKEMKRSLGEEKEKEKLLQLKLKALQDENRNLRSALADDPPTS